MEIKAAILLALFFLFLPIVSQAGFVVPTANLTIVVNTEGQDALFKVDLQECPTLVCNNSTQTNLQTQSLTVSVTKSISAFPGEKYFLTEESVAGLKINSVVCVSSNPADVFWYQPNGVNFAPTGRESITCTFNNAKIPTKTPVLIVPGLLGTEMKNGGETLWLDLGKMFTDIGDDFMDSLSLDDSLVPVATGISTDTVISSKTFGPIKYDYTEGLKNEFKNQGYVEGAGDDANLFTFPYDWRYGVSGKFADPMNPLMQVTNVDLLAQKIQDILTQTGKDKVDIVAHSMGGLIVKQYAITRATGNHIGKAVFVGVPNTGAPKAVKVLLQGDNFGIPWLSQKEMKKIAKNMPSAYDLLPSQTYYDAKGSYIKTIDQTQCQDDYTIPCEVKDLSQQESGDFLNGQGFNSLALGNAENLHDATFDNFDLRTVGINLYAIDGCKSATLSKVITTKYNDIFGQEISYDTRFAPGDNTVPLESATNLPIDENNKYYALVSDHGKMPSQDGIRQEIVNLISGSSLDINSNLITQDMGKCGLNGKAISVFSPVNIFVTDQNGNRLGLADDGSIINEIPGADFEILGEHKFVFLPTGDGQIYTINLTGTDSGTFTLKSQDIQNSQRMETEVFSNLPVTLELTGSVVLNATTSLLLPQGQNLDEQTILPDAILPAGQDDYLPPNSIATLTGEKDAQGNYTGDVKVEIKVTDDNSGVLALRYNLDDAGVQKVSGDTVDLTISVEGKHTVKFFGTDKAGNNEQQQKIEFEIKFPTRPPAPVEQPLQQPVAHGGGGGGVGGNALALIKDKEITPYMLPEIAVVEPIAAPEIQAQPQTPTEILPIEKAVTITKKIINQPVLQEQTMPDPNKHNPFTASLGNFGNWFFGVWHKILSVISF